MDEGDAAAAAQVKAHAEATNRRHARSARCAARVASAAIGCSASSYTAVDPFAMLMCRWTRGFARPARSLPHLGPYLQRVLARAAVQRARSRPRSCSRRSSSVGRRRERSAARARIGERSDTVAYLRRL